MSQFDNTRDFEKTDFGLDISGGADCIEIFSQGGRSPTSPPHQLRACATKAGIQ